ncbi:MAG: hypothetical protein ABL893_18405, partial [Hyphomicrobium sp.]
AHAAEVHRIAAGLILVSPPGGRGALNGQLKSFLRPFLAKSPEQAALFDERFDEVFGNVRLPTSALAPFVKTTRIETGIASPVVRPSKSLLGILVGAWVTIFLGFAGLVLQVPIERILKGSKPAAETPKQTPAALPAKKIDDRPLDGQARPPKAPEPSAARARPPEVQQDPQITPQISWAGFVAGAGLPAAMLVLLLATSRWRKRAFLVRGIQASEPYLSKSLHLISDTTAELASMRRQTRTLARHIQARVATDSNDLDIERTIDKAICNGGRVVPVRARNSAPPEYLAIIETAGPDDHEAARLTLLFEALIAEGVHCEVVYIEHRANRLFKTPSGARLRLRDVHDEYPNHRVLWAGTGDVFIEAGGYNVRRWAEDVRLWSDRDFLTTVSRNDWMRREQILARLFEKPPIPATSKGLMALRGGIAARDANPVAANAASRGT